MAKDNTREEQTIKPSTNRPTHTANGKFAPGNIANPNGRPKGMTLTTQIKKTLEDNPQIREALIQKMIAEALKGDPVFMKLIWNYVDGMPTQKLEHEGHFDITALVRKIAFESAKSYQLESEDNE